jgi:hypothetical protein
VRASGGVSQVRPIEAAKACIELALPPAGVSWTDLLATKAQESAHATRLQKDASAASVAAATQAVAGRVSDATDASQKAQQAAIEATTAAATVNAAAATAATHQAKVDEFLKQMMAFVMDCSVLDQREQRVIIDRMVPVVGEAITTAATLARLGGSCILILQVPGSVAQAAQDAACARPEELAACGLLALRVAGENAVALCAAGSGYIERLMAFDFSLFNTPIATDEFVQTAPAAPLAAGKMKRTAELDVLNAALTLTLQP